MKKIIYFGIVFSSLGFLVFCSDDGLSPDKINYIIPESDISYYDDLQPMFNGKCGFGSQCHSVENINNGLFFGTKESFINYQVSVTGEELVDPIKHRETAAVFAPLYLIVTQRYINLERQPPLSYGREPLTENQINGILQWIADGAND